MDLPDSWQKASATHIFTQTLVTLAWLLVLRPLSTQLANNDEKKIEEVDDGTVKDALYLK